MGALETSVQDQRSSIAAALAALLPTAPLLATVLALLARVLGLFPTTVLAAVTRVLGLLTGSLSGAALIALTAMLAALAGILGLLSRPLAALTAWLAGLPGLLAALLILILLGHRLLLLAPYPAGPTGQGGPAFPPEHAQTLGIRRS